MAEIPETHPAHHLFYTVKDEQTPLDQCHAITTLMYKVCGGDHKRFEEGCRLIGLFMMAAYEKGVLDGQP